MKTLMLIVALAVVVAGCAANHVVDVKYVPISPKYTGASVFTESTDPLGINIKTVDRYMVDETGNVTPVKTDSGNAPGAIPGAAATLFGGAAASTSAGLILPYLLPSTKATATVETK